MRVVVLCVCLATWLSADTAEGAEFHCASGDVACLIEAIRESNGNGEFNSIHLEAGTYSLTAGLPQILGSMTIRGADVAEATVIERAGACVITDILMPGCFRIFTVGQTGLLQLANLTVRRGNPGDLALGGAILSSGSVGLFNTVIRDSFAAGGGAIEILDGALSLNDSRIINNQVGLAGGIVAIGSRCCQGAPTAFPRSVTILRSSIADNFKNISPDIVSIRDLWNVQIIDSDVTGNRGSPFGSALNLGGAILPTGREATITGTTIANNVFTGLTAGRDVLISNSTIASNRGGISGAGPLRIQNSIVTGNDGVGDCTNTGGAPNVISLGHNLFGNPAGCGNLQADDLTGNAGVGALVDPGRPGGAYVPLLSGSRAIDAGNPAACAAWDQRGLTRPIDGNGDGVRVCDIGAVEFYPVVNDRLQLQALSYFFERPTDLAFAPAGAFRITATFANHGPDICHVAFDVVSLDGPEGVSPVLTTGSAVPVGGKGTAVSATEAYAQLHLPSGASQPYLFSIGVQQRGPINFMVNALGDATSGPCPQ